MSEKPTYERLEQRVRELEKAGKALRPLLAERSSEIAQPFAMVLMICFLLSVCLFTGRVDAKDLSEEKLRQRNEELLSVLDAIPALVWIAKDPECHVITGNRYVNDLFRVANDANVSQTAAKMGQAVKIIHLKPDGTELQAEELPMQQSIARGEAVRNVEFSYLFPDGRQVFAIGNAVPLFDEDGRVRGSVGAFLDITKIKQASATIQKRTQVFLIVAIGFIVVMGVMLIVLARMWQTAKRSEEALRESEDRFRIAGKVAYDLIYEWDVASDALEWFGDIDGLMGYRKGEISRDINAWLDLINPEDRVKLENAVELHKTSIEPIQYEYRVRYKDGTYRHWNDHGLPLLDDKGCPYKWVGVCTDITERIQSEEEKKELEAKLQRAEKMEAMGLMAGG
ncbi:MAG: PAS domain-containing protein, partial [Deltaproteobacteria bacterium]|nr:PAS domain-containing protein [Deltaproteobacteria bacterium]